MQARVAKLEAAAAAKEAAELEELANALLTVMVRVRADLSTDELRLLGNLQRFTAYVCRRFGYGNLLAAQFEPLSEEEAAPYMARLRGRSRGFRLTNEEQVAVNKGLSGIAANWPEAGFGEQCVPGSNYEEYGPGVLALSLKPAINGLPQQPFIVYGIPGLRWIGQSKGRARP